MGTVSVRLHLVMVNLGLLTFLLILSVVISEGGDQGRVSYDGYSVLELIPGSNEDIKWVQSLGCRSMTDWVGVAKPVHLLCNRKQARSLKSAARKKGISTKYVSKHLGRELKKRPSLLM